MNQLAETTTRQPAALTGRLASSSSYRPSGMVRPPANGKHPQHLPVNATADRRTQSAAAPIPSVHLPRWKRILDVALCIAALPALAPLTLLMAVITRLFAPGPIFFQQERIGHQGRRFLCLKFRTMYAGADVKAHQTHALELIRSGKPMVKMDATGDKRLIPFGWFLRATGLDELPQIINILRGEMSIVGPRPCVPYEFEQYTTWQRERFSTMPGLTGLWQVSGKNKTTFEEMVLLDIRYARSLSFWSDVRIIASTIPALVTQVIESRFGRPETSPAFGKVAPAAVGVHSTAR